MSDQFLGEIRLFGGGFRPAGWEFCDGQVYNIATYPALGALLGNTYGGDGSTTFAVPDLRGRVPLHAGGGFALGDQGGAEEVTLSTSQIPVHTHPFTAALNPASVSSPSGTVNAESSLINMFIADSPSAQLAASSVTPVGGSQPHENMQPFLAMNFIIATAAGPSNEGHYVGELRLFPYASSSPPTGWAWCEGQLIAISSNTALFALLGTAFGGDGKSTFALPDLQGSVAIGDGQGPGLSLRDRGEIGGSETVTLLESEIPAHIHSVNVSPDPGEIATPGANVILARSQGGQSYQTDTASNIVSMAPQTLPPTGGGLPHNNNMPYLVLRYAIALQGEFPLQ